jgi:YfiH family protein
VPPRPWTWLDQRHGAEVVVVHRPGEHAGAAADAAVTATPGAVLVVRTADCAPVALLAPEAVGIVHAGWRGLELGVVEVAVHALLTLGATDVTAVVGPCISPARYEFGRAELDRVAARYGDRVRATTTDGHPALDLAAGVAAALRGAGVAEVTVDGRCTASGAAQWFSHRARQEAGRQGSFVWLDEQVARGPAADLA